MSKKPTTITQLRESSFAEAHPSVHGRRILRFFTQITHTNNYYFKFAVVV
jgi:hypothetical protein